MKNTFLIALAVLLTFAAGAQVETQVTTTTSTEVTIPEHLKGLTTETLRPEHIFPALGAYKATGSSTADVTVVLDETNKGIVWVEGLSQGRFKAVMKKSPSTYKIPAQKSASGKAVSEGTLHVNPDTKEITIVVGRPFNDADPTSFLTSGAKSKAWQYTGVKTVAETSVVPPTSQQ